MHSKHGRDSLGPVSLNSLSFREALWEGDTSVKED